MLAMVVLVVPSVFLGGCVISYGSPSSPGGGGVLGLCCGILTSSVVD